MTASFGDSDLPGGGKRPATTIEGTATEIVEPSRANSPAGEAPNKTEGSSPQSNAKSKSAPPRTSAPELKSFVTHLAAGLLGGLVGVLALSFVWSKLPARVDSGAKPDLTSLEQRVGALETAPKTDDTAALDARVKVLETANSETSPDMSDLPDRVGRLEESLKALGETASAGGSVADAAALDTRISELEQKLQTRTDAKLAERNAADRQALEELKSAVNDLNTELGSLGATGQGIEAVEIADLAERTAKLEAGLSQLTGGMGQGSTNVNIAASVLALANLRAAIDSGRPFATELAAFHALAPDAGNFGALPAFTEQGIPTLPELTSSFKTASDAALAAVPATGSQDDSFIGSVLQSAQSVVKVRRIDAPASGDDPDAVLARADAKLKQGNLVAAVQEADSLQGAPRQALATWIDAARARASAEDTLSRLATSLRDQANAAPPAQNSSQ